MDRDRIVRGLVMGALALAAGPGLLAQSSITLTEPPANLLPSSFGGWRQSGNAATTAAGAVSLADVNKQALTECGQQRSLVVEYKRGGQTMRVEALGFGDRTGAFSAFTLAERPEMKAGTSVGEAEATGDGAVLFTEGDTVVLASPAGAGDLAALRELAKTLPKATGSQGVAPLLPSLVPADGLIPGSMRYALGPVTYAAEGGVLPPNALGWDKSAEAVTATYNTKHGRETLTLLLYPTPQIAKAIEQELDNGIHGLGPAFAGAAVGREHEMVKVASGSLTAQQAQEMLGGVHLRQEVTIDRDMPPVFHAEVQRTFSLLTNIAILAGVLMAAAVLLGLFLGGGRALYRVMRGKPAASEPEFLSLHLAPQNPTPRFDSRDRGFRS